MIYCNASAFKLKLRRYNKVCIMFSGTVVTVGRARGVVVGTGLNTAIGRINKAINETEEEMSPLKRKLDEFGTLLSKVGAPGTIHFIGNTNSTACIQTRS